jgi:multicomponent Na+:H+ antiporter subunit E
MPFQILLNLVIAFVWMFLNDHWGPVSLFMGYVIGLGLIYFLRRFLSTEFYLRRVFAIISLLLLFIKELILSSISVLKQILSPKLDIRPGIFAFPTELKSDWEITLLANLITLTPGTLTLEVSPDGKTLYIHAMDIPHTDEVILQIRNSFEKAIMEVSR